MGRTLPPVSGHLSWSLSWIPSDWVGAMFLDIYVAVLMPALVLTNLGLLKILLRRRWLAVAAFMAIAAVMSVMGAMSVSSGSVAAIGFGVATGLITTITMIFTMLRFDPIRAPLSTTLRCRRCRIRHRRCRRHRR